jgi:hypothetical protein
MNNIRHNAIAGIIDVDNLSDQESYLHFAEWWNGEGMDFSFDDERRISLSMGELQAIVVAGIAADFIDLDECLQVVELMKESSRQRAESINQIRSAGANRHDSF